MVAEAYDWTWGRKGVCLYCAHCAVVNEILPIEQHGTPMRVTDYPEQPGDRCRWTVYKDPAFVPLEAFTRGRKYASAAPEARSRRAQKPSGREALHRRADR